MQPQDAKSLGLQPYMSEFEQLVVSTTKPWEIGLVIDKQKAMGPRHLVLARSLLYERWLVQG